LSVLILLSFFDDIEENRDTYNVSPKSRIINREENKEARIKISLKQ
jgi:hypothetical protein